MESNLQDMEKKIADFKELSNLGEAKLRKLIADGNLSPEKERLIRECLTRLHRSETEKIRSHNGQESSDVTK